MLLLLTNAKPATSLIADFWSQELWGKGVSITGIS